MVGPLKQDVKMAAILGKPQNHGTALIPPPVPITWTFLVSLFFFLTPMQ